MSNITGSEIAKNGYKNEQNICDIFNNYTNSSLARLWLNIIGYDISNVRFVNAYRTGKCFKTDITVSIWTTCKNGSLELNE